MVFRQAVEMFPEEPLGHFKLAQAQVLCAEAQALCQELDMFKHAPGEDCLLDPACQSFEDNLQTAATQAGSADILKDDGILEKWDVEIKRSIGLCCRRGRATFKACLENAQALEYLLQAIIPEAEDIASLVMVYRRCGKKKEARKAVQVGYRPLFEGTDCRKDPLVVVQTALSEEDPALAMEAINEAWADSAWMAWSWPDPAMMQYLLAKMAYQAGDYATAAQALQWALNTWPDEAGWQAFAARIDLKHTATNRLQALAAATDHLTQAASLEPARGEFHLALGQIYLENGQVALAVQSLEQASRLDPENTQGWLALAKAQYLAGNLDQAAVSAERAIEQSEEPVEALLLRAEIALQTSNHRGAAQPGAIGAALQAGASPGFIHPGACPGRPEPSSRGLSCSRESPPVIRESVADAARAFEADQALSKPGGRLAGVTRPGDTKPQTGSLPGLAGRLAVGGWKTGSRSTGCPPGAAGGVGGS